MKSTPRKIHLSASGSATILVTLGLGVLIATSLLLFPSETPSTNMGDGMIEQESSPPHVRTAALRTSAGEDESHRLHETQREALRSQRCDRPMPSEETPRTTPSLRGQVVDGETGEPISCYRVHILKDTSEKAVSEARRHVGRGRLVSHREGRFFFDSVDSSNTALLVTAKHYRPIVISARANVETRIELDGGSRVLGRLISGGGRGLSDAEVALRPTNAPSDSNPIATAETDENGRFSFRLLSPGEYIVSAGYGTPLVTQAVGLQDGETKEIECRVPYDNCLTLDVVDEANQSVPYAHVRLCGDRANRLGRTARDGRLQWQDLPSGHYTIEVAAKDHSPQELSLWIPQCGTREYSIGMSAARSE